MVLPIFWKSTPLPRGRTFTCVGYHLPQAKFAHNDVVNRTAGLCPFQIVYSIVPRGPADLLVLPLPIRAKVRDVDLVENLI